MAAKTNIIVTLGLLIGLTSAALAFNGPPAGSPPTGDGSIATDASNRVGLGGAPTSKFSVNNGTVQLTGSAQTAPISGSGLELFYNGSTGSIYSYNRTIPGYLPLELRGSTVNLNSAGGTGLLINASNNVGIGTVSPGQKLDVQGGNINTSGYLMTGGVSRISNTGVLTNTTWSGNVIAIGSGGTGGSSASVARSNLGAAALGINSDITSLTGLTTPISETKGGTAQTGYATGDMLYAWNTNALSRLAIGTDGKVLTASGGIPAWADAAGDITGVTAGTGLSGGGTTGAVTLNLATPVTAANGGTGLTTSGISGNVLTSNGVGGWTSSAPAGDISGVTAGTGLTGGGTSGSVTVSLATPVTSANGGTGLTSVGVSGNVLTSNGAAWVSQAPTGDISGVTAGTGLSGGGASGAVTVSLTTPVAATNGGTAQTTYAIGDMIYASGVDTLAKRTIGSVGQVLTVLGGVPTWATPAIGITSLNAQTGATQIFANDTNVTISSSANTHTLGWSGALAVARGGTGATTAAGARTNLGAAASGANTDITSLSGLTTDLSVVQGGTGLSSPGAAGNVLTSDGVGGWTSSAPAGDISGVTAGTGLSGGGATGAVTLNLATPVTAANGGTGLTTSGISGNVLTSNGVGGWTSSAPAGDISGVTAGTGLTGGGTSGSVTVSLATPVTSANGGTGLTSPGASGNVLTSNGVSWVSQAPVAGGGEANTASNVGVGGVGVFKQKTGVNLEFKNVNGASGKVSVSNDAANNEIDVDVVESALTHDNIGGTLGVAKGGTGSTDGSIAGTGALTFAAGGVNQNVALMPSGSGSAVINGSASVSGGITAGGLVGASWTRLNNPPSTPATINAKAFSGLPNISLFDTTNSYAVAQIGENGDLTIRRSAAGNALTIQNAAGATNFNVTDGGTVTAGAWQGSAVGAAYGGTGLTSPGASGNVLTSDGTAWVSQAPAGGMPSSYTAVKFTTSGSSGIVTVSCPAGKKVLGGGCYGYYNNCRLRDSLPQSVILGDTSEGWYCSFWQRGSDGLCGGPGQAAYVTCM